MEIDFCFPHFLFFSPVASFVLNMRDIHHITLPSIVNPARLGCRSKSGVAVVAGAQRPLSTRDVSPDDDADEKHHLKRGRILVACDFCAHIYLRRLPHSQHISIQHSPIATTRIIEQAVPTTTAHSRYCTPPRHQSNPIQSTARFTPLLSPLAPIVCMGRRDLRNAMAAAFDN